MIKFQKKTINGNLHSWQMQLSCYLRFRTGIFLGSLQIEKETSTDCGCIFWGKIQIRISESKNGICVFLGKSINGSWIHKIHTQGGFFGSNRNPDFWDSQSERFFGRGFEKSTFDKQFFQKKVVRNRCLTCMTLKMNLCWWRALLIWVTYYSMFVIYSNYW